MHIYMRVKLAVQLERLEMLWQKLHDMGISGEDDGEDGGSGGPPSFPYISAISASRPSSSAVDSPADSSRHACLLLLHLMNAHLFELHKPCPCISSHSPRDPPLESAGHAEEGMTRLVAQRLRGGISTQLDLSASYALCGCRPTWQQVRKSPLGRPKPRRPALLSPLSSLAAPAESPWANTSAGSLRRLLLEKV